MLDATPLLRLYARARWNRLTGYDIAAVQRRQLLRLVQRAAGTLFGKVHGFDRIRTVADFQDRVPLRRYEDFWTEYWQGGFPHIADVTWPDQPPYFAATSGTTMGRTKYIPVTRAMVAANRRAAFDLLVFHMVNRPRSRVMGGRNFMLGGSTALEELAPGICAGDLSGIAANEVPPVFRPWMYPPPDLARIADWERKVDLMGQASLGQDIRTIAGTASWLLLYFQRLAELAPERGGRLADLYPNLELLVHGGVNVTPYRAAFEALIQGSRAELREVYPASEGFIAIADRGTGEGLRILPDNGLFLEFVPVEELDAPTPRRFWLADAEPGVNYALVLSSNAGLWAYVLGDTVRLLGRDPPRLLITGRTSWSLSAFGEHLIGEEIEQAVTAAALAIQSGVADFSVGAVHSTRPGRLGGHLFIVEFAGGVPDADRLADFAQVLDARLSALNADYRDHRAGGFGMDPPRVEPAPPGSFAAWMRGRGRLGGQNKVPRIIQDAGLLENLCHFVERRRGEGK